MLTDPTMRVLQIINIDEQFEFTRNTSGEEPMILNSFDLSEPNCIENLSDLIFSDGSGADFIAKCSCGNLEGNDIVGMMCNICNTAVKHNTFIDDNNLLTKNWLSAPPELPNGWMTPRIYLNLVPWLTYDKVRKKNYLDDILNVDTPIPFEIADVVTGKGFQYLHDNFDRIIDYFARNHPVISAKPETRSVLHFLSMYSDRIFCHYVPILNSAISPIISASDSSSTKKKYSVKTADHILKAAVSLSRLKYSPRKRDKQYHVEKITYSAYKSIIAYIEESTKNLISIKKAIPRTHLFGSRFHWSFRGVITPIIGPHYYYETRLPWKMAVNTYRVHIEGALCKDYNLTMNEAACKVRSALQIHDLEVEEILKKLIRNSSSPGIPHLWDRPPSIRDGSVMMKYTTHVKPDIADHSIEVTSLDVKLQNADKRALIFSCILNN